MMKTAVLAIMALFTLGACVTNTAGIYANSQGVNRVDNGSMGRKLSVEGIQAYPGGGQLNGYATLQSHTSYDQNLQYRFTWYDANNIAIDAENKSWVPVTLHGFQQVQVKSTAPNGRASWFDFQVRNIIPN
ncbi:YcfL family protein [Shewanella yunxiaonensis]|uniref:YcfL family protein n=1 Tax=Shewanella yunxiaonensis TaxID=2829809 RepID=A0ABX7YWE2_9GAMM|nr:MULTISPECIES: DUF1425 domain-containing protein [Shewanella]MDF0534328.1 DUF1425 domain-containing protein [Shewanella sp. A32]QUN07110.1 YcfL family protein [Shewanella yunxiaonensis]